MTNATLREQLEASLAMQEPQSQMDREADVIIKLAQRLPSPLAVTMCPPGWKLVPIEPTEAMLDVGRWPAEDDGPAACWSAMLAAAPDPADGG